MTTMWPPQHGHVGRFGDDVGSWRRCRAEQLPDMVEPELAITAGEQAVVADAVEAPG